MSQELGTEEPGWATFGHADFEHLLDVFAAIDTGSMRVWDVCAASKYDLVGHERRLAILRPKVEELSDGRPDPRVRTSEREEQLPRGYSSIEGPIRCKRKTLSGSEVSWSDRVTWNSFASLLHTRANSGTSEYSEPLHSQIEAVPNYGGQLGRSGW